MSNSFLPVLLSCCASCRLFCLRFFFFFFFLSIVSYRWGNHNDLNPCHSRSADLLCVAWLNRKHTRGAACLWGGGGRDKDLIMSEGEETGPQLPSGTRITWERIVQIRPAVSPQTHLWPPWFNCTYDLVQKKSFKSYSFLILLCALRCRTAPFRCQSVKHCQGVAQMESACSS